MIDKKKLLQLEKDYEIGFSEIVKYYTLLMNIPCVQRGGEDRCLECLETLIQDRVSVDFKQKETAQFGVIDEYKSFDYSMSDALYRIYEEESLPFLCEEYKEALGYSDFSL